MRSLLPLGLLIMIVSSSSACEARDTGPRDQTALAVAPAACDVRGAWSLDSVSIDGVPQPRQDTRQLKVIADRHYSWSSQIGGARELVSAADSIAAYRTRGFGGGTYIVTDTSYIERLELFFDPRQVGREVEITCRVINGRWEHDFDWPLEENGQTRTARIREIWRRIE